MDQEIAESSRLIGKFDVAQDLTYTKMQKFKSFIRKRKIPLGIVAFVVIAIFLIAALAVAIHKDKILHRFWAQDFIVKTGNVLEHLENLQIIANGANSSRSVSYGYNASTEYIIQQLQATKLNVTTQQFIVPVYQELQPPQLFLIGVSVIQMSLSNDFIGLPYGGNTTINKTATVVSIPNFGCS